MPVYSDKAVVLGHHDLSGADRIIIFLTEGRGKVKAVAKGVRRPKSRFAGRVEPLYLVEVGYFAQPERSTLARLNHSEVIEAFSRVRDDYDRLVRGFYVAELADVLLREGVAVPVCFEQVHGALGALDQGGDADHVRWGCAWRLLAALGYKPALSSCVVCKAKTSLETFNPGLGGLLCAGCRTPDRDGLALSVGAIDHLRLILELSWQEIGRMKLEGDIRAEVGRVVELYLNQHIDRRLKSAELLLDA